MEEWREYKIGDVCRIKHGFAFKGIYFVDDQQKYVCVTPGNFALKGGFKNDKPKYYNGPIPEDYVLQKDDLVVTMTDLSKNGDTLGYSALIPYDEHYTFLHNQRIGLIEDISNEIDKHFLYWVMRTYDYQRYIVGHCSGSTVKHTSPSGIGSYIFRCPDMEIQREISSILDNLDDKIEVNRKINENLEQQAQALFKSWFVDFEPFKDGEFVESELGMIPKGWRVGKLGDCCKCILGGTPSRNKPEYWGGDIAWINSGEVNKFRITTPSEYITEEGLSHSATKLLPKKTTVLAITGATLGQVSLLEINTCANQSVIGVLESIDFPYSYVYPLIKEKIGELMSHMTGGAQQHINKNNVEGLDIIIPLREIMISFNEIIYPIYEKIGYLCQENVRLAELRDTLLPRLMSGELKVDEINL